jgi:pimeloyl-ACP methyl ester carboxylesterase
MTLAISEHFVNLGQVTCHSIRTRAEGQPFVLFHGVTRDWQTFLPIVPALVTRWQVLALTFRGHGASSRTAGAYRVVDYVRDAVAWLLSQLEEPAIVYGHSLGAMVAAAVAAEVPEAVRAVILEDPPFDTMGCRLASTPLHSFFTGIQCFAGATQPLPELAPRLAELEFDDPVTGCRTRLKEVRDAAAIRYTARCLQNLDPQVLDPIVAGTWLDGYERDAILRHICCPALLLQADPGAGGMLSDADARMVESLIPDCTRVQYAAAGHLLHGTRTQEVLNSVHSFLAALTDSAARVADPSAHRSTTR